MYQTQERVTDSYGASYLDGKKEDFDVIKTQGQVTAGNRDAQTVIYQACARGFADDANYFAIQGLNPDGSPNPELPKLVDVDNVIDYMLLLFYTGNADGPGGRFVSWPNNYYSIFNRKNPDGFKFFAHDMEHSLDVGTYDMTQSPNGFLTQARYLNPYAMHTRMVESPHYLKRFRERTDMHFYGDGALTDENALARFDKRKQQIEKAILAHSARWGDAQSARARTPADWERAVTRARNWVKGRGQVVISQFMQRGWYDGILPPKFVRGSGQNLYLKSDQGNVYYTTTGRDPIDADGNVLPNAQLAEQPKISDTVLVTGDSPLRSLIPDKRIGGQPLAAPGFQRQFMAQGCPGCRL